MIETMIDKSPKSEVPGAQDVALLHEHGRVVAELQGVAETLDHAVKSLQHLAMQPGYGYVARLLSGYEWSLDQVHELNTTLIVKSPAASSDSQ